MSEKVELYVHNFKQYEPHPFNPVEEAIEDCKNHFFWELADMFITECNTLHTFDLRRKARFSSRGMNIKFDSDVLAFKKLNCELREYCEFMADKEAEKLRNFLKCSTSKRRINEFIRQVGSCFGTGEFPSMSFNIINLCGTPYMFYNLEY